jgi:arylsulfatase A-like enzyme
VAAVQRAAHDSRPLAAWFSFCSPHHPIDPPQEYADRYANTPVPAHCFDPGEAAQKPIEQQIMFMWDRIGRDEAIRQQAWRYYYATIELVDEQIGRVLDALRQTGRYADALIIFTADHGEMLFQHGLFDKAFAFYDDVYRVPTVVRWTSQVRPGRYDELVEHVDLVPLLYRAAGLPVPPECSGADLLAMLRGSAAARTSVLGQHFHMRMIRTRRAKLVNYAGRDYGELYDLDADPQEMHNLWDHAGARDLRAQLLKQLADRLTWATDPAFRELEQPTNKGAYGDYLKRFDDLRIRYLRK